MQLLFYYINLCVFAQVVPQLTKSTKYVPTFKWIVCASHSPVDRKWLQFICLATDLNLNYYLCHSQQTAAPSFDPTEYVQKQRVTKTTPPKPAYNPLQFIQIKPCNLYQSAQDQLRKAEDVKKTQITKKEEPEDWQGVSLPHSGFIVVSRNTSFESS